MADLAQVLADAREEAAGVVYYLADARTPRRPRYVGSTKQPALREHEHRKPGFAGNGALTAWKDAVRAAGSDLVFVVLAEYATIEAAREAEWRLIRRWQRRGFCDCNTEVSTRRQAWRLRCAGLQRAS